MNEAEYKNKHNKGISKWSVTMKTKNFLIQCSGSIDFAVELSLEPDDEKDLFYAINENIEDIFDDEYIQECLDELIDDYIYNYSPVSPYGLDLDQIYQEMYAQVHNKIDGLAKNLILTAAETGSGGNSSIKYVLDTNIIISDLHNRVLAREECEQSDCDTGGVVEKCLQIIEDNGTWKFGLKYGEQILTNIQDWPAPCEVQGKIKWLRDKIELIPIIWFGTETTALPDSKWSISFDSSDAFENFWFEDDSWYVVEYLVDNVNDGFLIWYFPECGRCAPDMAAIIGKCPIAFAKDDTNEIIERKINTFFVSQYEDYVKKVR